MLGDHPNLNEAARIEEHRPCEEWRCEIIVVDGGSADHTDE
jgi:hypothetical protein